MTKVNEPGQSYGYGKSLGKYKPALDNKVFASSPRGAYAAPLAICREGTYWESTPPEESYPPFSWTVPAGGLPEGPFVADVIDIGDTERQGFYPNNSITGFPVVMGSEMPLLFWGALSRMSRAW